MRSRRADRGQSEVLGVVLLLGLAVVSVGLVTAAGNVAVDATRANTQGTAVENALYQYDAAASEVAYGSADQRRVTLGSTGEGRYEVRPDNGTISVVHRNYTGTTNEPIIDEQTLGALVYERGDTAIAAQGGAVFRQDGEGSVLLSAPRMAYRSQTFTVPVIAIRNGGERAVATDDVNALVEAAGPSEVVYPNRSNPYGNGDPYTNPISGGEVAVVVESDYYTAWGEYFRSVSPDANVTINKSAKRATLVLPTDPVRGDSVLLDRTQSLRGINDSKHAVNKLNVTIPSDRGNWNGFDSATVEIEGLRGKYVVEFENVGGGNTGPCEGDVDVDVTATYSPNSVNTEQTWERTDAFQDSGGAFTYDCLGGGDYELYANLTGATTLTYESTNDDPVTFEEHDADGDTTYDPGTGSASINLLTNHYVALAGGNTELNFESEKKRGKSSIDQDAVTGNIDYDSSTVITYLRATNTTVNTTLS